jgi:glycosyltransferase involved in cell wall biosynthesis
MLQASVIICTHNPRPHYLRRVLAALRAQTLQLDQWELVLIDNASREALSGATWDLAWHPYAYHVREDELGLASARLRGMREARADMLVFVDDDNLLAPDYLEQALRIKHEWPMLGVWGCGVASPEFEAQPPDALRDYLNKLAIRENKVVQFSNVMPCYRAVPWGTGQCLRAQVAVAYREQFEKSSIKIKDRTGPSFDSAGDLEIVYVACALGMGVGIFPQLKLVHLIPKERLEEDYLVKLVEGIETSIALVEYKWLFAVPSSPFAGVMGLPRVIRTVLTCKGIRRRMYLAELRSRLRARTIILKELPTPAQQACTQRGKGRAS